VTFIDIFLVMMSKPERNLFETRRLPICKYLSEENSIVSLCDTSVFLLDYELKGETSIDACGGLRALEKPRAGGAFISQLSGYFKTLCLIKP
jgi:hypothetical protein